VHFGIKILIDCHRCWKARRDVDTLSIQPGWYRRSKGKIVLPKLDQAVNIGGSEVRSLKIVATIHPTNLRLGITGTVWRWHRLGKTMQGRERWIYFNGEFLLARQLTKISQLTRDKSDTGIIGIIKLWWYVC
jgi:hypothetical protein